MRVAKLDQSQLRGLEIPVLLMRRDFQCLVTRNCTATERERDSFAFDTRATRSTRGVKDNAARQNNDQHTHERSGTQSSEFRAARTCKQFLLSGNTKTRYPPELAELSSSTWPTRVTQTRHQRGNACPRLEGPSFLRIGPKAFF